MVGWKDSHIEQTYRFLTPKRGEVLIQVAAAGVNNTDVNTRIGWYSKAVTAETGAGG
jgi:NADPH:quinone reductase-like Zn-dependent oxidoreductase